jgi:FkbM family methyltransferase
VIEQKVPERCSYLCIDAEPDLVEICRHNHRSNPRVEAEQHFIGDIEGAMVRLVDDGRANAATKLVDENSSDLPRLVRLDTIGAPFAEAHGKLSLIKVDVEGFDFSVLRSAEALLRKYEPCLYFEWFPELLTQFENDVCDGFDYLTGLGFTHFVFFTNVGYFHIKLANPDRQQLEALSAVTRQNTHMPFFDVFASTSAAVCEELTRLNIDISR